MGETTAIEWCDSTWNPLRGCTRVNEACRNCYAERTAARFAGPGMPYAGLAESTPSGPRWTGEVRLVPEHLDDPLRWKRPRRIFVNSMSDLLHPGVPDNVVDQIMARVALAQRHTFILLTKRPERMRDYFGAGSRYETIISAALRSRTAVGGRYAAPVLSVPWPFPNLVLGVSVHDQASANAFVPLLLQTPAACRIASYEPALGPVDWRPWLDPVGHACCGGDCFGGCTLHDWPRGNGVDYDRIEGIIAGGESGPKARPAHPDWYRATRDQCAAAGVSFFFKQWGRWAAIDSGDWTGLGPVGRPKQLCVSPDGMTAGGFLGKGTADKRHAEGWRPVQAFTGKAAGRLLDGREHNELPYGVGS